MSRTKNSVRNMSVSALGQIVQVIVQFVCRTFFVEMLGSEYLGVNGLFSNILSMLSLSELGFGAALTYSMYEPLHKKDMDTIQRLLNLYRKIYKYIILIMITLGMLLLPVLPVFIKDYAQYESLQDLHLIYLMFLTNTAASYVFVHKRSLIDASQNSYVYVTIQKMMIVLQNVLQIVLLWYTHDFFAYLAVQIAITLLSNIIISRQADRMFPVVVKAGKDKLPSVDLKKSIYKNTLAMSMHKLGAVLVDGTDNLILSKMVSLESVAVYSNYCLLIGNLNAFVGVIFRAVTASVGDLGATKNKDKQSGVFYNFYFISFWFFGFTAVGMTIALNHFVYLWVGEKYVFSIPIVLVLVLNYYLRGMRIVINIFRDALGVFWYDRYKPIFEALINLIASVVLVKYFGIIGVFIGTAVSTLMVNFWVEPYVLFKYVLKGDLSAFIKKWIVYFVETMFAVGICYLACNEIPYTWSGLLLKCMVVTVIYNMAFILVFYRSDEFRAVFEQIRHVVATRKVKGG